MRVATIPRRHRASEHVSSHVFLLCALWTDQTDHLLTATLPAWAGNDNGTLPDLRPGENLSHLARLLTAIRESPHAYLGRVPDEHFYQAIRVFWLLA